jgi:hypothetical protein
MSKEIETLKFIFFVVLNGTNFDGYEIERLVQKEINLLSRNICRIRIYRLNSETRKESRPSIHPFLKHKMNMLLGPYSQHFIFFVTYEWAEQARVLYCTKLEGLARDKHSSKLGPFVGYEALLTLRGRGYW